LRTYRKNTGEVLELPHPLGYLPAVPSRAPPPEDPLQTALSLLSGLPELLLQAAQRLLDLATRQPIALAWAALGLAVLFTALHRHALRPLSALVLGGACVALSLGLLGPALPGDSGLPGIVAVLGAGASLGLGLASPGVASALICMLCVGALGGVGAVQIGHFGWVYGAAPFGLLGLATGFANQRALSVWMPPLWSALLCALAVARLTSGAGALAQQPAFAHPPFAGGLFLVLAAALLAVSLERDHRKRLLEREGEEREKSARLKSTRRRG
jgi:hypothetical protein